MRNDERPTRRRAVLAGLVARLLVSAPDPPLSGRDHRVAYGRNGLAVAVWLEPEWDSALAVSGGVFTPAAALSGGRYSLVMPQGTRPHDRSVAWAAPATLCPAMASWRGVRADTGV